MPIVDGLTSTKMIRSFEMSHPRDILAPRATLNGRVPIFAVSASLVEKELRTYIDVGFDGWVLKPIDFKRLGTLLEGIVNDETRQACLYQPGEWERGGWFRPRDPSVLSVDMQLLSPPELSSGRSPPPQRSELGHSGGSSAKSGDSGTITPTLSTVKSPPQPSKSDEQVISPDPSDGNYSLPNPALGDLTAQKES